MRQPVLLPSLHLKKPSTLPVDRTTGSEEVKLPCPLYLLPPPLPPPHLSLSVITTDLNGKEINDLEDKTETGLSLIVSPASSAFECCNSCQVNPECLVSALVPYTTFSDQLVCVLFTGSSCPADGGSFQSPVVYRTGDLPASVTMSNGQCSRISDATIMNA